MKYVCCQNCSNCTNVDLKLDIGECEYDGEINLKYSCGGFMWNYYNENEYKGED